MKSPTPTPQPTQPSLGPLSGLGPIFQLSLQEAWQKKLVATLFFLSLLFLAVYLYGIFRLESMLDVRAQDAGLEERSTTGAANLPMMLSTTFGMYLVYFLTSIMSVLSCVGAISQDYETGTLQSMLYRPISRAAFVLGRWLGFWVVNMAYLCFLSVGLLGGIFLITGYLPPEPHVALGLLALVVTLLTSVTLLGSTLFSTLANGIGVFVLYGLGFAGGILYFVGRMARVPNLITIGEVSSYLMPSNALWLAASYHLQPPFLRSLPSEMMSNPFLGSGPAPAALIVWAALLSMLCLGLAIWRLSDRDM